ncbi:MAG: Gfo/Idh/MocA family oxidoreductase [Anaerolineales bacterium]|nr:MAG: Gfo/Idh/MocA family oxidoreductase [Anaerolineales bacterium]
MSKIGVIGCGYWGPKLARNFHQLGESQLAWVCDKRVDRLEHVKQLYPQVRTTEDYRDMLASDVDAVVVATPVCHHHPLALAALRAGKHVLVEKPIAASVQEAEEIVAEGERLDRVVMVGHTFEYNAAVETMKKIIGSGELGRIYYINATRVNLGLFQPDINVVWDLAPHDVSILLFALGLDPDEVSARGGICVQREKGIHDVAYLTLYFPNGVLADVRVSWLDPCKIRRYTVVGSEKMLVYDDIAEDKILIYDKGVDVPPHSDTVEEFHLSYRHGDGTPYDVPWVEPLKAECRHFLDCIRERQEPRSSGRVGLKVVKVLEAAQRSLLNGGAREQIAW